MNNRRAGNGGRTGAPAPKPAVSPAAAPKRGSGSGPATNGAPPPVPPKVPPKSATPVVPPPPPQLVEMLMEEEEGEVLVGVNTDLETHIARANRLLAVSLQQPTRLTLGRKRPLHHHPLSAPGRVGARDRGIPRRAAVPAPQHAARAAPVHPRGGGGAKGAPRDQSR